MIHYSIISTMEDVKNNKYLKIKKFLPLKLYLYYLKKNIKTIFEESVYLGEKGDIIMLPFTSKEFDGLDEEYKLAYIEKVIKVNGIENLYVEPNIGKYVRKIDESLIKQYNTILLYMMLPHILKYTLQENCIDIKEMRLTIIDSGDCKIDYILKLLVNDLNYLTIITQRPEYFNEFVDIIYDNTGLLIEVVLEFISDENSSDIIIDLSKNRFRYSGKIVIDLENDIAKRQYQYSRSKNTSIIYDIKLCSGNRVVNNELLGYYLIKNHPYLQEFIEGKNNGILKYNLQDISKELNLKLEELIYL